MKTILLIIVIVSVMFVPAFGQLSDKTGLNSRHYVEAGGQDFEILTSANFDVTNAKFDLETKTLVMGISSSLTNNLGETTIPKQLLSGDLRFILDGEEFVPDIKSNDKIWFITTEFTGKGLHTLQIVGTESINTSTSSIYIPENNITTNDDDENDGEDNGCLIATAAFGSELSPQVQQLRELRDNIILKTESGSLFMSIFNQFYYAFSPTVSDWERQNPIFKETVKVTITPLLSSLSLLNHADINSEEEMIGYGIGIIMMNVGMYFSPIATLVIFKKSRLFN